MSIKFRVEVENIKDFIINTRRDIHKYPELAFQEKRTASLVAKNLKSWGIEVEEQIGKTGVVGLLKGNNPNGKTIALRADMDALPVQEVSDVEYKSVHAGVMHACGHDGHTAILLGAAKVLSEKKDLINGNVKFIFQPAEEGYGGAKYMVEDNALEGVDEIYGMHLWNYQEYETVGVKTGETMACADLFDIKIKGTGGHGATPHGTVDAIVVASSLINSLQTIVSRNTNPLESTVVSVGMINGGNNFNIIADEVNLRGTTRAYTQENRDLIKERMLQICKGIEKAYGAEILLEYQDGYPPVINDEILVDKLSQSAKKIVGDGLGMPYLSMGGEDFSYFANEVPGCFFFVGSAPQGRKPMSVPHHCSHFDIDERSLLVGSSIFIQLIEDQLISSI
jgi:amidohydrolase